MSRGKANIGIAVLFALALSAFAASSASATGSTAYTCVKDEGGALNGPHCLTTEGFGKYKHVEIAQDTTTTGTATNVSTASGTTAAAPSTLKGNLAGVTTEITCSEVNAEGTFENKKNAGGEMYAHFEGKLHFTGCVVSAPAGKGCKVAGGTLTTSQVTSSTQEQGAGAKITPKEGVTWLSIKIEGCSIGALNNTFPVTGAIVAQVTGSTQTTTHAEVTAQNTLKFGGNKAGTEGALTYKAHSKEGEETVPVVATPTP